MKRLIFLFDGTWNSAATGRYEDITNVFRLNLAFGRSDAAGNPQITFYFPGPGNRGKLDKTMGGVFGQGIDQIVREAYVNLSSNYVKGDKIYLFGFSRGSIAARALAYLIGESGLLKPAELFRLSFAWKRAVNRSVGAEVHGGLVDLANSVHEDVKIEFVGLFDSVLGRKEDKKGAFSELRFPSDAVTPIIEKSLHILSIDESRLFFKPMVFGLRAPERESEQIWFPGTHSDIGGTGLPKFVGIAVFLTMLSKIKDDLLISPDVLHEFIEKIKNFTAIEIRNERELYDFTPWNLRKPNAAAAGEYLHPLFDQLYNKNFVIRGENANYNFSMLKNFLELPRYEDDYTKLISECAERILVMRGQD